jgi:alanine racemase
MPIIPRAQWLISLECIKKNVINISKFSNKKVIAVVKANAYGHGLIEISRYLERLKEIVFFAVSSVEEGVILRERANIKKPILILGGFLREEFPYILEYNLTPVVSNIEQLKEVVKASIPYHMNVDTGMGRLGFTEIPYDIIYQFPPEGLMTHLSCAEIDPEFSEKQISNFFEKIKGIKNKWVHVQNTAGLYYKVPYANLVRVGVGIYGDGVNKNLIKKGLEICFPSVIKARIIEVKKLKKGHCISYGCRYKLKNDGYIGVIALGYADGLFRGLFHKVKVFYKGKPFPVRGNITMDFSIVEFGKIRPKIGEEVEIINEQQRFSDLAKVLETIPYEIMTKIGERVKRVYKVNLE